MACKGGAGICLHLFDILLGLLALGLVGIIASIHLIGTVSLPGFLREVLQERLDEENLDVTWSTAHIDLTGRLHIFGFECREASTQNPILTAAEVSIDWDLLGALRGTPLPLEQIFLREGVFQCRNNIQIQRLTQRTGFFGSIQNCNLFN